MTASLRIVASSALLVAAAMAACSSTASTTAPDPADSPDAGSASRHGADGGLVITPGCPDGLGARWTCDGSRRIRCVDDQQHAEACASGCTSGDANEAVCSCGTHSTFSRYNCEDGHRMSCAGGVAWVVDSCNGKACVANATGTSDGCADDGALEDAVRALGETCAPLGIRCSIAVRDLTTNERAGFAEQSAFVSASAAKVFWVAAGLFDTSIAAVSPYADAIFSQSDNIATGHVLDLLGSPDRVNTFLWQDAEVADIGFCDWNYGGSREATNCPDVLGGDNFFTTSDAVSFLRRLYEGSLLGTEKSKQLLSWMTLSPRTGYGGWFGTQLPASARSAMHHKAGWLPPEEVPGYANANEIGIVEIPGGHAYAAAFALDGAASQEAYDTQELPLLEYLSCGVYHAVVGEDASACTPP